jgi:hypothetical protein
MPSKVRSSFDDEKLTVPWRVIGMRGNSFLATSFAFSPRPTRAWGWARPALVLDCSLHTLAFSLCTSPHRPRPLPYKTCASLLVHPHVCVCHVSSRVHLFVCADHVLTLMFHLVFLAFYDSIIILIRNISKWLWYNGHGRWWDNAIQRGTIEGIRGELHTRLGTDYYNYIPLCWLTARKHIC